VNINLSTKGVEEKMKFRKVTASKYIGDHGYTLRTCRDGSYSICKDGHVTEWGQGFTTVRSAEIFLEKHDYINATRSTVPISDDDLQFILEFYEFKPVADDEYVNEDGVSLLTDEPEKGNSINVTLYPTEETNEEDAEQYTDITRLLTKLDKLIATEDKFKRVMIRDASYRSVFAKTDRRSTREIVKDLVRVNSSNVWAYGSEIKDPESGVGDVYVQFKARNGGPGDIYRYMDVPIKLWQKFISYPSKGAFIWKYLRNNFLYNKLTGNKKGVLPNAR